MRNCALEIDNIFLALKPSLKSEAEFHKPSRGRDLAFANKRKGGLLQQYRSIDICNVLR
jgi:hypothetical protein